MNFKKIIILSLLAVMLLGCISTASAGWFDNGIESDSFKFNPIEGYSKRDVNITDGVQLMSDDDGLLNTITVRELKKDEYDNLIKSKSPASLYTDSENMEIYKNGEKVDSKNSNFELLKEYDEGGVKVVAEKMDEFRYSTGIFEKNGSYYLVQIMNIKPDSIDKDIQIVNDIHNSLEKK